MWSAPRFYSRPLLFLLYINHITLSNNTFDYILFADSNLYISSKNDYDLCIGNRELNKVTDLMMANKLALNLEKMHYVVFAVKIRE